MKLLFLFCLISTGMVAQELSFEEKKLYESIMEYRSQHLLPSIPLSKSLTHVAKTHLRDLVKNKPDVGECGTHSWSNKGKWTAVCYNSNNPKNSELLWNKPRELTSYYGYGFEIIVGSNECCLDFIMTSEYALDSWKESPPHNSIILNENGWADLKWSAIGIAIYKNFSCVWFGEQKDNN